MYQIAIILPASEYYTANESFKIVLSNTPRILLASFAAFVLGSLLNSYIMVDLKNKYNKSLFVRCIFSTLLGEALDSLVFFAIAFGGQMPISALVVLMINQTLAKTLYEIVIFPVTKFIISYIKNNFTYTEDN